MMKELKQRSMELQHEAIETIYFGGGTPSILPSGQISSFIDKVKLLAQLSPSAEITLEANPDDMTASNLHEWKKAGVNRLSIGVQSFDDTLLRSMNRSHNAEQARAAILRAKQMDFRSLSLDIIFGLPEEGLKPFEEVVAEFIALAPDHISAYSLTLEKGTVYHHRSQKGELDLPSEEEVERQFIYLIEELSKAGYEQYEVSNFSRLGHISEHNSSYWKGKEYIGIGPSAHSYNGKERRWNISNNMRYMKLMAEGEVYWETESIDDRTAFNEYVLTRSRTKWGLDLEYIKMRFQINLLTDQEKILSRYSGKYELKEGILRLNRAGLLLADRFASDLFKV